MVEMGGGGAMGVVIAALAVVLVPWLWAALVRLVWRPYAVARAFARQGVRGPPYRFLVGNSAEIKAMLAASCGEPLDRRSNDIVPRVAPHLRAWTPRHGKVVLSWHGPAPRLWVCDYDMVRRILSDKAGLYVKPDPGPAIMAITGMGLVFTEGDDWARHRRVVHPALAMDRIKAMTGAMAACAGEVIRAAAARGEVVTVEVGGQFTELTADVIARTAFGSSYRRGKEVFLAQRELQLAAFATMNRVRVPLLDDYVPTKANVRRWQLARTVRDTLMAIIDERLDAARNARGYGTDLLGLMLEANANAAAGDGGQAAMSMDEIIDECKTFFFAGHDTTAHLLTWAMFLLGTHLDWQRHLREEVLRECGGADVPLHGDALNKLKLVTMVLYETLRLYSPVNTIHRHVAADVDLCGVKVPKGTALSMSVAMLHRDEEVWGPDAGEFRPLRFRDGVGRAAAHPSALLSFSFGPRSCIGQDFAMMEAKATLALILRRFSFEVAPEYVHAPTNLLTLQPLHGLPVVLKLVDPQERIDAGME